jgi:hypothetical protein
MDTMGLGGLLEFFCNFMAFSSVYWRQIIKKQLTIPKNFFFKKRK